MSEPSLIEREVQSLHDLASQAAERAAGEAKLNGDLAARGAAIESEYQTTRRGLEEKIARALRDLKLAGETERATLKAASDARRQKLQQEYDLASRTYKQRFQQETGKAKKSAEETRWQASAVFDSGRDSVKKNAEIAQRSLAKDEDARVEIEAESTRLLDAYKKYLPPTSEAATAVELSPADLEVTEESNPVTRFQDAIRAVDSHNIAFHSIKSLKILRLDAFVFLAILLAAFLGVPGTFAIGFPVGTIAGVVAAIVLMVVLRVVLMAAAKKGVARVAIPLRADLARSAAFSAAARAFIDAEHEKQKAQVEGRRDAEIKKAEDEVAQRTASAEARLGVERKRVEETYPAQIAEETSTFEAAYKASEEKSTRKIAETRAAGEAAIKTVDESHATRKKAHAEAVASFWGTLSGKWTDDSNRLKAEIDAIHAEDARLFPDWRGGWHGWNPPAEVPPVIRFGEVKVSPAKLPNGVPKDERLQAVTPVDFALPSLLDFRKKGSLLIRAADEARDEATELLQALMLRMLTAIPAGKIRFTILDPVGLGRNFASFMHLIDYDEQLINHRIWTDPSQIDQRLKDLTEHMENVILTYLRNDYATIEEYNAQAGEVSEPYRVLVVANFPHGFTDASMKSLQSVVSSGARCGVHTLISVDTRQPIPSSFNLKDLDPHSVTLTYKEGKVLWKDAEFESYKLVPDAPPTPEAMNAILHEVGKKSKEAKRVEVPFDVIAPKKADYWTTDSRSGIDVPLGRAGATKFQNLKLGKGTSQHVLIAGKTGSGKSTLLHALITNVALRYSPKEVEMFLIDFKKGVEFKTYAAHGLPHARVIAVESEREFGLSVLQRLDSALKDRGELYRAAGAQDVASYRNARPGEDLPRMLLLVDEFQEFFVEDDKLAQEASLLLDRLVRQGRAFGIHVHLGSQSLGGAYGLARTTLAQMAIRIALQCSEADAHMILSEENSAARLLSRPGEAIYNDSNGMIEGNHVFQIVWLSDERRVRYLDELSKMADERDMRPKEKQIVFEGNNPADLANNPGLNRLLDAPGWPELPRTVPAWLGEAIAIKDPTEAPFQPQSGSHLLMVGQQGEAAAGVLTSAILGLAAYHEPHTARGATFYLFDGTPSDSPLAGLLPRLAEVVPHPFKVPSMRALGSTIAEIHDEVERRRAEEENAEMPAIYLVIHDLTRFRDLRKAEDDFGSYGSFGADKPPSPSKQFVTILREGPAVNVHVLTWCDTVANLNRTLDRQGMGEFEMRVLFQMSAADSSALIDTPAAGRLGENRAFFYSEEQGRLEKFRPFSPPTPEVLADIKRRFDAKPKNEPRPEPVRTPKAAPVVDDHFGNGNGNGNGNGDSDVSTPADDAAYSDPWSTP